MHTNVYFYEGKIYFKGRASYTTPYGKNKIFLCLSVTGVFDTYQQVELSASEKFRGLLSRLVAKI